MNALIRLIENYFQSTNESQIALAMEIVSQHQSLTGSDLNKTTVETKLSKLRNGNQEGEQYFFSDENRKNALAAALKISPEKLEDAHRKVNGQITLILDPTLPEEAIEFIQGQASQEEARFTCYRPNSHAATALRVQLKEAGQSCRNSWIVTQSKDDLIFYEGADLKTTGIHSVPRGWSLDALPDLIQIPPPPAPELWSKDGIPMMPCDELSALYEKNHYSTNFDQAFQEALSKGETPTWPLSAVLYFKNSAQGNVHSLGWDELRNYFKRIDDLVDDLCINPSDNSQLFNDCIRNNSLNCDRRPILPLLRISKTSSNMHIFTVREKFEPCLASLQKSAASSPVQDENASGAECSKNQEKWTYVYWKDHAIYAFGDDQEWIETALAPYHEVRKPCWIDEFLKLPEGHNPEMYFASKSHRDRLLETLDYPKELFKLNRALYEFFHEKLLRAPEPFLNTRSKPVGAGKISLETSTAVLNRLRTILSERSIEFSRFPIKTLLYLDQFRFVPASNNSNKYELFFVFDGDFRRYNKNEGIDKSIPEQIEICRYPDFSPSDFIIRHSSWKDLSWADSESQSDSTPPFLFRLLANDMTITFY